jgi:hypothetical protein
MKPGLNVKEILLTVVYKTCHNKKTHTNQVNKNGHQLINMLYLTANYD